MDGQNQKLFTIQDLEKEGIGNRVSQWRWREKKEISFYKIGGKILYSEKHIADFLSRCERPAKAEKQAA